MTPFRSLKKIQKTAEEAGYDGITVMPTRMIAKETRGSSPEETRLILAGNQSFRGEKTLRDVLKHPNPVLALQVFLTLPHNTASLKTLKTMQEKREQLGLPAMPVTLQTAEEAQKEEAKAVKRKGLILTPDNYEKPGTPSLDKLPDVLEERGINNLVLDTYQIRRLSNNPLANPKELIYELWKHTSITVVSLGREDLPTDRSDFSHADLSNLFHGDEGGEIYDVLHTMRETMNNTGHVPTFVVQIPESGLRVLKGAGGDIVTTDMAIEIHARVLGNLKKALKS